MNVSPAKTMQHADPLVSVIIPARDEEASLGACLESLVKQSGLASEIIVVDDASVDRTRQIAESFSRVKVIAADPPAANGSGKSNAAQSGARIARGRWLLFTDADTVHQPGSLARALAEAQAHGAELLSYSPKQEVRSFWEKAILPLVFADLAATYRPKDVSDPGSPAAAANGQYLLITRKAYDAVGGHAAVGHTLLEDVALARAVKGSGRKIFFRYGGDAVRTRMYRNFAQLCEGWTKNLALLFPATSSLAARRTLEFVLLFGSPATLLLGLMDRRPGFALVGAATAVVSWGLFLRRLRRAHFGWKENPLASLGLPVFVWLLLRSQLHYKWRKRISWKGREYSPPRASQAAFPANPGLFSGETLPPESR